MNPDDDRRQRMPGRQEWAIRNRRRGILYSARYPTRGEAEAFIEWMLDWGGPRDLDAWPVSKP